jgi:hypothetical protein
MRRDFQNVAPAFRELAISTRAASCCISSANKNPSEQFLVPAA